MEPLKVWIVSLLEKKSRALLFEVCVGGGAGHPDPEIRGSQVSNKHIFQPVWSLTTRGGPGSATFFITGWSMYMYLYDSMSNGKGLGWSTPSLGSFWQMLKKGANHAQHQFLTTTNQSLLKQCPPWSGKLLSSPKILETGTWLLIAPSMQTADVSPRSSPLRDVSQGERLRLSDRNSILMTQNLSGIQSEALIGRRRSFIVLAIVYEWKTKGKRPQRSNVNAMNL